MTTITLTDPDRATQASTWIINNIGYQHWTMNITPETMFSKNPRYAFTFDRKQDAVLFSLKWM